MGVDVAVGGANDAEVSAVKALFADWEQAFSRFRADSELTRVNRAGHVAELSPLFADVLARALAVAAATHGLVDPTLGTALAAAGYDRDFAQLDDDDPRPAEPPAPGRWRELDLVGRMLFRPPGVRLDLNGVVKALAADEALDLLSGPGFVAAGGDVAVRGSAVVALPDGGTIRVGERRDRDEREHQAALEPQRPRSASPDRPGDRATVAITLARGHRRCGLVLRRRRRRKGRLPARRRRPRLARGTRPACAASRQATGRVVETSSWREALAA